MNLKNNTETSKIRLVALGLALVWALFWTLFGLLSGIGEGIGFIGTVIHAAVPGLIFLFAALIAWRWTFAGSILLLIEGFIVLIGYPIMTFDNMPGATIIFIIFTMASPPLIAGLLLILHWRKGKEQSK